MKRKGEQGKDKDKDKHPIRWTEKVNRGKIRIRIRISIRLDGQKR